MIILFDNIGRYCSGFMLATVSFRCSSFWPSTTLSVTYDDFVGLADITLSINVIKWAVGVTWEWKISMVFSVSWFYITKEITVAVRPQSKSCGVLLMKRIVWHPNCESPDRN